jgi:hypothetical protein
VTLVNAYCSLAEVKASLRIPTSDTVDDALLTTAINSSSRQIDGICERVFYNAGSAVRVYVPEDSTMVETDDLISVTRVRTNSGDGFTVEIPATDYQLEPLNGIAGGIAQPFTRIRATGAFLFPVYQQRSVNLFEASVEVQGVFGWSAIPEAVKQAAILLSIRTFKRLDSPFGVAGFGDLGVIRVGRTDPDIEALLMPFKKPRMA